MYSLLSIQFIKYITVRFGLSVITSFILMLLIMPKSIKYLKQKHQEGQPIRNDGPDTHLEKKGTPTMGGIYIIFSIICSTLLWANLKEPKIWIVLSTLITFCIIGYFDDFAKLTKKSSKGIKGKYKFFLEILISFILIFISYKISGSNKFYYLQVPVFKNLYIYLGVFYFLFGAFVVTGSSNAVNLTDGLDGLVSMPVFLTATSFAIICYFVGHTEYSHYLHVEYIKGTEELTIICGAIMGACLGFLWFNAKPAEIFMGDTGSLSLGGTIGMIAILSKHELILFIVGFIFVIEALSVILQVGSYKLRNKKRIFLMAPIHHHFEKKGLSETKVVIRFWITSFIFTMLGLALVKLK